MKVTFFCSLRRDSSPPTSSVPSSFFPSLTASQSSYPGCRKSGGQKHYWRSSEPNHSQARAAANASQAFLWPNWIEADHLFLACLTEGEALVFLYGAAKHLCVRWLVVNKLLLPGSWLEMETHSLKFSKGIKKPCEAVPFTESRGTRPAWLRLVLPAAVASLAARCQLGTPTLDIFVLTLWQPPVTAAVLTNAFHIYSFCAPARHLSVTATRTRDVCTGSRVTQCRNGDRKAES